MKDMRKAGAVALCLLLLTGASFAGGKTETAAKGTKVTWFLNAGQADQQAFKDLKSAVEKDTGYSVEFNVIPAESPELYRKIDLALMAGDTTDIMPVDNEIYALKYASNEFVLPLDGTAKAMGVDLDKAFGKYLPKYRDRLPTTADDPRGHPYFIPVEVSLNQCFFNKRIFDDAGVPYPKAPWSWNDLVATAKKITNPAKGIYGLFTNEDYEYQYYFQARQKDVVAYRNGSWDFTGPDFKNAIQFYARLGNEEKVMPSRLEFDTKKIQWDAFMTGKYGMWIVGSWAFQLFGDRTTYPRDWKYGVTSVPTPPDGSGNVTLGSLTLMGVCKNSKHPDAALRTLLSIANNYWSSIKTIPAKASLTAEERKAVVAGIVSEQDGITADIVDSVFFRNGLGFRGEKYIAPGSIELSDIWTSEAGLCCIGQKSLDESVVAITKRMNEAARKQ
jgi:multiple sugar transport system substrate-binding protein